MTCLKVKFRSEQSAKDYLVKLQKTSVRNIIPNGQYLCEKCMSWHLTSTDWEKQREKEIVELRTERHDLRVEVRNLRDLVVELRKYLTEAHSEMGDIIEATKHI